MNGRSGRAWMVGGMGIVVIGVFLRLFIPLDMGTANEGTALRVAMFTQVMLGVGCACIAVGMFRRSDDMEEPVVRAAYVVGAAILFVAVLAKSL